MQIIHIVPGKANPNTLNGVNKVVDAIATEQTQLGYKTLVVGVANNTEKRHNPIYEYHLFTKSKIPFVYPKGLLVFLLNQSTHDTVFHFHSVFVFWFLPLIKALKKNGRCHIFLTPHGQYVDEAMKSLKKRIAFNFFDSKLISEVEAIHVIGYKTENNSYIKSNAKRIAVIPNGFGCQSVPEFVKSKEHIFGYLGRLECKQKGLDLLITAFIDYKKKGGLGILRLAGSGPDESLLKRMVVDAKMEDYIFFDGVLYDDAKWQFLYKCSFFVHPSRWDVFPTACMEAAYAGCILLVSDKTNLSESISKYDSGICLETLDSASIREKLFFCDSLFNSSEKLLEKSEKAHNMILEEFNWHIITKKIMKSLYLVKTTIILLLSCLLHFSCTNKEVNPDVHFSLEKQIVSLPCSDILEEQYGICAHVTRTNTEYPYLDQILDLMDDLHISWVRSDMDWYSVSSKPGDDLNFVFFDGIFEKIKKHPNIHLLPIIVPENPKYPTSGNDVTLKTYHEDWRKYVEGVISRYQTFCPVWEGFNEWDQYLFNNLMTDEEGIKYQQEIYDIAKKCASNITTLAGCLCSVKPTYERLAKLGISDYYEINNQHSYVSKDPESSYIQWIDFLSQIDNKLKIKTHLWLTEFGYSTSKSKRTEEEQALYIPRTFITSFAKGIDKVFLYSMRAREYSDEDPEAHYGITHKDLSPKPAYYAMRNLTRMLPSKSSRPVLYSDGNIYLSSWSNPELGKVYAIWTREKTKTIKIKVQGQPKFYSFSNIETPLDIDINESIEVGPGIIYIVGASSLSV